VEVEGAVDAGVETLSLHKYQQPDVWEEIFGRMSVSVVAVVDVAEVAAVVDAVEKAEQPPPSIVKDRGWEQRYQSPNHHRPKSPRRRSIQHRAMQTRHSMEGHQLSGGGHFPEMQSWR